MNFIVTPKLAEVLITKISIMNLKRTFMEGGPTFMGILTILLIITTAWIIFQFVVAYRSKETNLVKSLRMIGYGKTLGLFALVTGILGQLIGFTAMFDAIGSAMAAGEEVNPILVYGGIKVTMIVTIYGILIYLFSLLLWFIASSILEKKR